MSDQQTIAIMASILYLYDGVVSQEDAVEKAKNLFRLSDVKSRSEVE